MRVTDAKPLPTTTTMSDTTHGRIKTNQTTYRTIIKPSADRHLTLQCDDWVVDFSQIERDEISGDIILKDDGLDLFYIQEENPLNGAIHAHFSDMICVHHMDGQGFLDGHMEDGRLITEVSDE